MSDISFQHPTTKAETRAAVSSFESHGETAMSQTGAERDQSIHDMQDYLKTMTPQERKDFYNNYDDVTRAANGPSYSGMGNGGMGFGRSASMPTGFVTKDSSGEPVGIHFSDSAIGNLWSSVTGQAAKSIDIKP